MTAKKKIQQRKGYKINDYVVYPAHGVGIVKSIEVEKIADAELELFVIEFAQDKMILRVPTNKVHEVGMRKLADRPVLDKALKTLKGKPRVKRTMWSRRAQEYEAKINSGDLVTVAEVVRDLFRADTQPEQSYSERQLYERALERMAREVAAVEKTDQNEAVRKITRDLEKSAAKALAIAEAAAIEEAEAEDGDGEEKAA